MADDFRPNKTVAEPIEIGKKYTGLPGLPNFGTSFLAQAFAALFDDCTASATIVEPAPAVKISYRGRPGLLIPDFKINWKTKKAAAPIEKKEKLLAPAMAQYYKTIAGDGAHRSTSDVIKSLYKTADKMGYTVKLNGGPICIGEDECNGYHWRRNKLIKLNGELDEDSLAYAFAHELAHAKLWGKSKTEKESEDNAHMYAKYQLGLLGASPSVIASADRMIAEAERASLKSTAYRKAA
jgi:hypothetical protein